MARPVSITDEQILDAAREVFLRDGIGASTVEIARLAGISEGSIFRRFPTKDALFRAAIKAPDMPSWVRELHRLAGVGDMRSNLEEIVCEILRFARGRMPLVMLGWSHPAPARPDGAHGEPPIARDGRRLAEFLRDEIGRGRLRECPVEMVARLLLAPSVSLVMDSVERKEPLDEAVIQRFAHELVATLWHGLAPEG